MPARLLACERGLAAFVYVRGCAWQFDDTELNSAKYPIPDDDSVAPRGQPHALR
jgi:hypothetical protein